MSPEADRKPIIWAFSASRLRQVFESVAPLYADRAELRVFDRVFEDALQTTRELVRAGEEVDTLVAAGANGAYLRDHAAVPVVVMRPTTLDVLQALTHARALSPRIGVVNFLRVMQGLEQSRHLLAGTEVEQRAYVTPEEAKVAVSELAARGVEVIVGTGRACELADRAGLKSVLLFSTDSVGEAIERAVEISRIARAEEGKRERIEAVLGHLDTGVLAVDMEERVQSVNPALERLLGVAAAELRGKRLSSVAPTLSLARALETEAPEREEIQRVRDRTLVVSRIPLRARGVQTGALLTCQDSSAVQRLERSLRSQHRPRRFVARYLLSGFVGTSMAVQRVRSLAERYARTDATVLITGESGTGKEIVAQGIHNAGTRRDHPFVAINCASFPEALLESELFGHEEGAFTGSRRGGRQGLFEAAHSGTIFLDEVGDVPLTVQTRLLRVLQERQVLRLGSNDPIPIDVRVVAATNRDLRRAVSRGQFRDDLYYRLNILPLHVPPLRERRDDITAIAADLLQRALLRHGAPGALARVSSLLLPRLQAYEWPGNVREMENVLERVAVLFADRDAASPVDEGELRGVLPELYGLAEAPPPDDEVDLRRARGAQERAHIQRVLDECGGNQSEAARRLGIGRSTLYRKLNGR